MGILEINDKTQQAGKLRHRITIIQKSGVLKNSVGQEVESDWIDLATVWAHFGFKVSGTNEEIATGMLTTSTAAVVKIRHRSDVTTHMRVKYKNVEYPIGGLVSDDKERYLFIFCESDNTERDG